MNVDQVVLDEQTRYCEDCPLKDQPYVVGLGYSQGPVMVVGTAPGATEEVTKIAFTGKHGSLVRAILADMGVDEERTYYTNVIKRRPVNKDGENRKPNKRECYKCGSHLVTEIVRNRPSVVLALGAIPLGFISPSTSSALHTMHGLPIPVQKFAMQFVVVPTYDPSFVLRQGGLNSQTGDQWLSDLQDFADIARRY